jgi:hypothetical protein
MKKKKSYLLILFFSTCVFCNSSSAQSYILKSFEGENVRIKLTNKSNRALTISCLKDTIFVNEYMWIREVHVLKDKFLQIIYDTRGGSGLDLRNTLILLVDHKKINVSMLVTSYARLVSSDKKGFYKSTFNLTGSDRSNYKIVARVHDEQSSKLHPENNYNKANQVTFHFDNEKDIFYSAHNNINKSFTFNDPQTKQSNKQQVNGSVYTIAIGQQSYYYINSQWYKIGYDDNLFKEYYK